MFRVEFETKDCEIFPAGTIGLPETEQVALLRVYEEDRCSRHGVVSPGNSPAPSAVRLARIAPLLPSRQVSVESALPYQDGYLRLISQPAERQLLLAAAAAAATVQRSWAWDESEQIVVTITTPQEFRFVLDPVHENGAWIVRAI